MKVESIELKNFKKHGDLIIDVQGKSIFLLGPNEAGKSSILDSIFFALNPGKETPETKIPKPLKEGAAAGHVKIVVGTDGKKYTVTRKFTEGSDDRKLTIVSSDGLTTSKVDMLEKLIGYKKVNPFEFVEWGTTAEGRRKQLQLIESLLPPEIIDMLNAIKQDIAVWQEKATAANSEKQGLEKSVAALGVTERDILEFSDPIDISEEMNKLTAVQVHNQTRNAKSIEVNRTIKEVAECKTEIEELRERIADLEHKTATKQEWLTENNTWLNDPKNQPKDEDAIRTRISEAQAHNNRTTLVTKHEEMTHKVKAATETHNHLKAMIEGAMEKRKGIVSLADLPVPGLTFDAEQVYLNGMPLHDKQISTSQIMKLAFAIALATGGEGDKLKLICIPRGESLDNNSLNDLKMFLQENPEWQAFLEEVDRKEKDLKIEYLELN